MVLTGVDGASTSLIKQQGREWCKLLEVQKGRLLTSRMSVGPLLR